MTDQTTPPLDLTPLRERAAKEVRRMKSGEWSSGVSLSGMTLNALLDRLEAAEAKLAAVRELHQPIVHTQYGPEACWECAHPYPCPTITTLGGGA